MRDELERIDGVGDAQVFGAGEYSMRVWLDPEKVAALNLTASDVVRAIREQNVQVAAGQLGAPPAPNAAQFQLLVDTQGRLVTEEEFEDIVVKTGERGQITRLKDVARVELGASTYALRSLLDNEPAVAIPVFQQPGSSNAIEISNKVRAKMAELKRGLPGGRRLPHRLRPDGVRARVDRRRRPDARRGAAARRARRRAVPAHVARVDHPARGRARVARRHAAPSCICFGFSLNALSLFGLVLAIGIVVDDAIVVVENVERNIAQGLSPIDAAKQAMSEVTSPIIAISAVLIAVFVPTAFISGLSGQFYEQFALTIAISTVISAINSLTLSPALAALLLKPHGAPPDRFQRGIDFAFGWAIGPFNRFFEWLSVRYVGAHGQDAEARGRAPRSSYVGARRRRRGSASRACRRASSRSRTRSTSSRSRSCPKPRRSIAPRRSSAA